MFLTHDELTIVFSYLPVYQLMPCFCTCKYWNNALNLALSQFLHLPHFKNGSLDDIQQRYQNWTRDGSIKCLYFCLSHYLSNSAPRTFAQYLQHHPIWQHYVRNSNAIRTSKFALDSKLNKYEYESHLQMQSWPIRWRLKIISTWTSKARNSLHSQHVMIAALPFRGYYGSGSMVVLLHLNEQARKDVAPYEARHYVDETEQLLLFDTLEYKPLQVPLMNNFFLVDGNASFIEYAISKPSSFLDRTPLIKIDVHSMHLVEQVEQNRIHMLKQNSPFIAEYWNRSTFTKPYSELDFLQHYKGRRFIMRAFASYSNHVLYLQWEHAQKAIMCHVWHTNKKRILVGQETIEQIPDKCFLEATTVLTSPMTAFVENFTILQTYQSWAQTMGSCATFLGLVYVFSR